MSKQSYQQIQRERDVMRSYLIFNSDIIGMEIKSIESQPDGYVETFREMDALDNRSVKFQNHFPFITIQANHTISQKSKREWMEKLNERCSVPIDLWRVQNWKKFLWSVGTVEAERIVNMVRENSPVLYQNILSDCNGGKNA